MFKFYSIPAGTYVALHTRQSPIYKQCINFNYSFFNLISACELLWPACFQSVCTDRLTFNVGRSDERRRGTSLDGHTDQLLDRAKDRSSLALLQHLGHVLHQYSVAAIKARMII